MHYYKGVKFRNRKELIKEIGQYKYKKLLKTKSPDLLIVYQQDKK